MVKYPGGTPGRWEKVACDMGRSVKDVSLLLNIAKVKMWMACKTVFCPEKEARCRERTNSKRGAL